jgi:hypothetical protein
MKPCVHLFGWQGVSEIKEMGSKLKRWGQVLQYDIPFIAAMQDLTPSFSDPIIL